MQNGLYKGNNTAPCLCYGGISPELIFMELNCRTGYVTGFVYVKLLFAAIYHAGSMRLFDIPVKLKGFSVQQSTSVGIGSVNTSCGRKS